MRLHRSEYKDVISIVTIVKNLIIICLLPPQIRETASIVLKSADAKDRWSCSNPGPAAYLLWGIMPFINISISPLLSVTWIIIVHSLKDWWHDSILLIFIKCSEPCLSYCQVVCKFSSIIAFYNQCLFQLTILKNIFHTLSSCISYLQFGIIFLKTFKSLYGYIRGKLCFCLLKMSFHHPFLYAMLLHTEL